MLARATRFISHGVMKISLALLSLLAIALPTAAGEPKELTSLRETWLDAREKEVAKLDEAYLKGLKALRDKLLLDNKMDDAEPVEREIQRISGGGEAKAKSKVTAEQLATGEWRFDTKLPKPYTTHFTLKENGEVIERGAKEPLGTWSIKDDKILRLDLKWSWAEFDIEHEGATPSLVETKYDGGTRKGTTLTQARP
jgi:hypothetical protein